MRSRFTRVFLFATIGCLLVSLFVYNSEYVYGDLKDTVRELSADDLVDPRSVGQTFQMTGTVVDVFRSKNGLVALTVLDKQKNLTLSVPIFASLGRIEQMPSVGSQVLIFGNLGFYKGRAQLKPLSAKHVRVLSASASEAAAVDLKYAMNNPGQLVLIGPVQVYELSPFVAKKSGKRHLRLTIGQDGQIISGICFEGNWSSGLLDKLENATQNIYVSGTIGEYRGSPNITVNSFVLEEPQ